MNKENSKWRLAFINHSAFDLTGYESLSLGIFLIHSAFKEQLIVP